MHEKNLYEYAVIRVVPRVEREEFLNVGIVLFCKKAKFIKVLYSLNVEKVLSFSTEADVEQIEMNLMAFEKVAHGTKDGGPIALMDIPSRFRWLTALRSSVIQSSRPHPGLCDDLEQTTQRLFEDLVL
ncbi:DUF3037 domain-containing protein [Flavobacterium degerlachei]|jgi:hypothetical protein|uniref:DUF3037 domain-containing protein n=1 Tax=Flavobacterium degerlachei TaxID=229203 RepID=A0A1H2SA26_9FLAO|nr:DUF3037 domain-containing protein [Flavobacterium degerlachei]SDW28415.1 Protein of unknown function [Flavobacterium degerlachei]